MSIYGLGIEVIMQPVKQWIRRSKLLIKSDNQILDLTELHFKFRTKQAVIGTPKVLELKIYNPHSETVQFIMKEGLQIEIQAGYEVLGVVFSGQIRQVSPGKENGTDTYVEIRATDQDDYFKSGFISETIARGTNVKGRLDNIVELSDVTLKTHQTQPGDDATLPRGRVYHGPLRKYIKSTTAAIACDAYVENGVMHIIHRDQYLDNQVYEVNAQNGMIGLPEQTIEGVVVKTLLNPVIKVGSGIKLNNNSIQLQQQGFSLQQEANFSLTINPLTKDGVYKVVFINHEGDSRGQAWYSTFVCYDIQNITPQQLKYLTPSA